MRLYLRLCWRDSVPRERVESLSTACCLLFLVRGVLGVYNLTERTVCDDCVIYSRLIHVIVIVLFFVL